MKIPFAVLSCALVLPAAPALAADAKEEPVEKPATIVPLNVRDPSSLVMGPYALNAGGKAEEALPTTVPPQPAVSAPRAAGPWTRLRDKSDERVRMPKGYRSVSVPVSGEQLLDLRTGDRVDVVSVFDAAVGARREKLSATILQNVKVVGLGAPKGDEGQGTVLLMLNPSEVQMAALALYQGQLMLARRDPGDEEIYPMEMSTYRKLFR